VAEALRSYVKTELEFVEAVEVGIRAADEGRLVPHEVVIDALKRRYRAT
jgi:predicted transcriptional regulator